MQDWSNRPLEELPIVDLRVLHSLTADDAGLERELYGMFRVQLSGCVDALLCASNEQEWKITVHTMKGSALSFGAYRLARLADHLEHTSPEAALHEDQGLVQLSKEIERCKKSLDAVFQAG